MPFGNILKNHLLKFIKNTSHGRIRGMYGNIWLQFISEREKQPLIRFF